MLLKSSVSRSARPAVLGGARLRYTVDPTIGTQLKSQWVRPPLHLAKAYTEKDWAISLLTSPTAGLLEGDKIEVDVSVDPGAKVALISPAACRVHMMDQGNAVIEQSYKVGSGALLDVWPAPLILQKDARLEQSTRVEVAGDSVLLFCEVVSPGRAAYGESFTFTQWKSRLKIFRDEKLVAFENFSCRPGQGDLMDWRAQYPEGSYASFYFLAPFPMEDLVESLHQIECEEASIGASPLREGGMGIKILAADGLHLRKTVFLVRKMLYEIVGNDLPHALRRAQTFFH
jgi:urease accessory protein